MGLLLLQCVELAAHIFLNYWYGKERKSVERLRYFENKWKINGHSYSVFYFELQFFRIPPQKALCLLKHVQYSEHKEFSSPAKGQTTQTTSNTL